MNIRVHVLYMLKYKAQNVGKRNYSLIDIIYVNANITTHIICINHVIFSVS